MKNGNVLVEGYCKIFIFFITTYWLMDNNFRERPGYLWKTLILNRKEPFMYFIIKIANIKHVFCWTAFGLETLYTLNKSNRKMMCFPCCLLLMLTAYAYSPLASPTSPISPVFYSSPATPVTPAMPASPPSPPSPFGLVFRFAATLTLRVDWLIELNL